MTYLVERGCNNLLCILTGSISTKKTLGLFGAPCLSNVTFVCLPRYYGTTTIVFAFLAPLPDYDYAIVNCILGQKIKEPPHVYH